MPTFDAIFAPGGGESVALVLCRLTGLFLLAPTFTSKQVPAPFTAALLVLFTALAWPAARASAPGALALAPTAVLGEVLVGMALGLPVALLLGAAEMAGELIGTASGLAGAASIDPVTFQQTPTMGTFLRLVVLTLLLTLDLHLVLLDGLAASFVAVPLGAARHLEAGAAAMAQAAAGLFVAGLRLAAPVLVALLVLNVALGLVARAAPQLQVMAVAFPLQAGLGLVVLGTALPFVAGSLAGWTAGADALVDRVVSALQTGGR